MFRSCECIWVETPSGGDEGWTMLLELGDGHFYYGRMGIGKGLVLTSMMIHMPYTAKHDSIHTLVLRRKGELNPPAGFGPTGSGMGVRISRR